MIIKVYEKFGKKVEIATFSKGELFLLLFIDDIHVSSLSAPTIMEAEIMAENWMLGIEEKEHE